MAIALKSLAKQLVPEKYRLARYALVEKLKYYPELLFSLGRRLECPFCHWHFRRFKPAGFDYPVLKEKRVVGAAWHPDDVCPRCMSNARERLVYLYLTNKTSLLTEELRVLHIAPEPNLASALKKQPKLRYVSADLFEPNVMTRLDILSLPFRESTFDVVICNHVLEHVQDDGLAMAELFRVLKVGGWALLQVPIAMALAQTIEDPTAVTEEDRIRVYGQRDHVRLYSPVDYPVRLRRAGFEVNIYSAVGELGEELAQLYGLVKDEQIYACSKPESLGQVI